MARNKKTVVIIIPTYNEKDNIGRLAKYLQTHIFPKLINNYDMHILVVDDSSPDGTADVVRELEKTYKNIHLLLNEKKMGLGAAYLKGMNYATKTFDADVLIEMDADFSHDPKVIPAFLKKMEEGNDLVVGSRYVPGGSIPANWGFHRKFLSIVGNWVVRIILTHFAIHDWTGGYRAIRRNVFEALKQEMDRREFSGYTFQIGFLHKTLRKGFSIAEVPIHFVDREYGESKIGPDYIVRAFRYLLTIRIQELKRMIKFGLVGTVGFIVNYTALEVFHQGFGISPDNAAAMGAELAIISNFTLNNVWTFKDRKITERKHVLKKFVQFNVASLGSVIIQKVGVWLGIQIAGKDLYPLYFVLSVCVAMFLNFVIYTKVIWKHTPEPIKTPA